ncbi:MAG: hypothetical protein KDM64_12410 [Verrucomicrobiae bacterium]|nr:hypothetical protein [Verrucomicrobiae bacterium]
MYFPELVDQEDYERFCGRSLRLFLSVDIANSTALKQEFREKDGSWLEIARSFYTAFPTFLTSALDALSPVDPEAKPSLWKAIGDELVFVAEIGRMEDIPTLLRAHRAAVNQWNRQYEATQVLVKAGAWLAGFPVMNSIIPGETPDRHDYIGSSIDTGFRLCRFASPRRFVVGVEVAYVVAHLNDPLAGELHYDGRHEIRGVLKGMPYPIIWVDCFADSKPPLLSAVAMAEDKITGRHAEGSNPKELESFLTAWIKSTSGEIQFPFPPRQEDSRFPLPSDYGDREQKKREEFERVYLQREGEGETDGNMAPSTETESLIAKLKQSPAP